MSDEQLPLEAWGIDADTARISALDPNVHRIDAPSGSFVMKTLAKFFEPSRLAFMASVTEHMVRGGIHAQAPVAATDGSFYVERDGRNYILMTFIDGARIPGPMDASPDLLRAVGRQIGRMHGVLATYPTGGILEHTWRQDVPHDIRGWLDRVRPKLPDEALRIYKRFEAEVLPTAVETQTDLPEQLIHRDCHPGNIVDLGGEVFAFIDCDHFCVAPRVFELAYYSSGIPACDAAAMDRWVDKLPWFLGGYDEIATLTDAERDAIPYAIMSVFVMMAWWFDLTGEPEFALADFSALGWVMDNLSRFRRAAAGPSSTRP